MSNALNIVNSFLELENKGTIIYKEATGLPASTDTQLANLAKLDEIMAVAEQVPTETWHHLHGGMYSRTLFTPKDTITQSAFLEVATILIISGKGIVYNGEDTILVNGYGVVAGSKGRKIYYQAIEDTYATAIITTTAKTIEDAEKYICKNPETLSSRRADSINHIFITGE
jgi:hypothetical protein